MAASSSERDSLPRMPFLQHLEALRSVLITALVVVGVGTLVAWPFAGRLLDFVIRLLPDDMPAHVFAPAEAFLIRLKVSAAAGLFAGAPIVLWKVWSFLAPALYRAERRRVSALFILSTLLFYAGTAFAYLVIRDDNREERLFEGWMFASAPALNALDHARYDIWVLGCE